MTTFNITFTHDDTCYPDFYEGHGHAFDNETLRCIPISIPVNGSETIEELLTAILEDANQEIDFQNEANDNTELQDQIKEYVTDYELEKAFLSEIKQGTAITDKYFGLCAEFGEETYLYGYFHITQETQ